MVSQALFAGQTYTCNWPCLVLRTGFAVHTKTAACTFFSLRPLVYFCAVASSTHADDVCVALYCAVSTNTTEQTTLSQLCFIPNGQTPLLHSVQLLCFLLQAEQQEGTESNVNGARCTLRWRTQQTREQKFHERNSLIVAKSGVETYSMSQRSNSAFCVLVIAVHETHSLTELVHVRMVSALREPHGIRTPRSLAFI